MKLENEDTLLELRKKELEVEYNRSDSLKASDSDVMERMQRGAEPNGQGSMHQITCYILWRVTWSYGTCCAFGGTESKPFSDDLKISPSVAPCGDLQGGSLLLSGFRC